MSLYDYMKSQEIAAEDYPFYALIMAAMRQADTMNAANLKREWPKVWEELEERHNAPGGFLDAEEMAEESRQRP